MSMTLEQAFAELRTNEELARRFSEKPEEVLKELGVEEENLHITSVANPVPPTKTRAAGVGASPAGVTICASVGVVACASIGSDVSSATASRPVSSTRLPTTPPTRR